MPVATRDYQKVRGISNADDNKTLSSAAVPGVLVVGALNMDVEARLQHSAIMAASNQAIVLRKPGGVAANAARVLARSVPTRLLTSLADDADGRHISDAMQAAGVVVSNCLAPGTQANTGQYLAIMDEHQQLLIGLADTQGIENLSPEPVSACLETLPAQSAVVMDCNLAEDMLKLIATQCRAQRLIALAVSPLKVKRLLGLQQHIDLLILNRAEALALLQASAVTSAASLSTANANPANSSPGSGTDDTADDACAIEPKALALQVQQLGFKALLMTNAAEPLWAVEADAVSELAVPPLTATMRSVNGAGDALAGGVIAGLQLGMTLTESVSQCGFPAAAAVMSSAEHVPSA